jgi:hypothetical protein
MSQNVIIVDNIEYTAIKAMASKTMQTYESMFINKVILRRYASLLPAYIGGGFSDDELNTLHEVREGSRVDIDIDDPEPEPEPAKTKQYDKDKTDIVDIVNQISDIYKSALDANKKPTSKSKKILNLIEEAKKGKKDGQSKPIVNIALLPQNDLVKLLKAVQKAVQNVEA